MIIPHSRPTLGSEEAEAVKRVVLSGMVAEGPEVAAFEHEFSSALGCGSAVAVAHGTGALHLALLGLGAGPGRKVILPAYCCVSVLNAVLYTGASPVLADSVPDAPDVDLEQVRRLITPGTAAVVVPHLFGRRAALEPLPVPLVEDGTQSLGVDGLGRHGQATIFSFYATKMLAGAEGGAVLSHDEHLLAMVRDRRSYDGRTDWAERFNYKMTDLSGAMLRVQLGKLERFIERRRELAAFYRERLGGTGLRLSAEQPGEVFFRFVVEVDEAAVRATQLRELGVDARLPVFRPVHHYLGLCRDDYPHAESRWRTSLSLPLYPSLTHEEAERVVQAATILGQVMKAGSVRPAR
ncbi:DegT/DnrJ/EryC1/StrS aminotransferase family protein [bacterium CPR1]|nr:DegT/DnrJ/EryC1/StrS aminotransferase family protein [bacterium CPR1]